MIKKGNLKKMKTELAETTHYKLVLGEQDIALDEFMGKDLRLTHTGNIFCSHCGKKTKKSFSQGFCFPCMRKLASCDMCIMKPETCHYAQGTCREPEWGQENCMIDHYVYLANTSGLKVGITRHTQIPTRWLDQGATQALPIFRAKTRHISGLIEVALAQHIADKTNWRAILKGNAEDIDLKAIAQELIPKIESELAEIKQQQGADAFELLNEDMVSIQYPVEQFPTKISSFNFDKDPQVAGTLRGIKGQYLIFDTGVINIRKFGSYEVEVELGEEND